MQDESLLIHLTALPAETSFKMALTIISSIVNMVNDIFLKKLQILCS